MNGMPGSGIRLYKSTGNKKTVLIFQVTIAIVVAICSGPFLAIPFVSYYFILRIFPRWSTNVLGCEAVKHAWPVNATLAALWSMSVVTLGNAVAMHGRISSWVFWSWIALFPVILMGLFFLLCRSRTVCRSYRR